MSEIPSRIYIDPGRARARRLHRDHAIFSRRDINYYCENNCRIVNKQNERQPLKLNIAQEMILQKCNQQIKKHNQVRLVIIKGRQQGVSTLCRAIILWKMSYWPDTNALIVAQREKDLREKAFRALTDMYHMQLQKMPLGHCTSTQIKIDHGRLGYSVCFGDWAAAEGQSRGDRYNVVHLTEVDYYPDWNVFWGGLSQSIPSGHGSMVLIESTSSGRRALWDLYQKSLSKDSPFDYVFIPWFVQQEYSLKPPSDFELTREEAELKGAHGLTNGQIFWRRVKREELGSDTMLSREYPNTPEEAFSVSSNLSFFDYDRIQDAMQTPPLDDQTEPLVMGIDPSRNRDSTGICLRKGRTIVAVEKWPPYGDLVHLSHDLYNYIADKKPKFVYIDIGAMGYSIYDLLRTRGVVGLRAINFGERADNPSIYLNRRSEMYSRFKQFLLSPPCSIPDDSEFLNQMLTIEMEDRPGKLKMVGKHKMLKSPDIVDACVLCFAEEHEGYLAEQAANLGHINIDTDWNSFDY